MKIIFLIITFSLFCLQGCAVTTPIQKVSESKSHFEDAVYSGETNIISKDVSGEEQYRIFIQGATGFVPASSCREDAENKATQFCEGINKKVKLIQETISKPPHILGNFPRAELIFACINKPVTKPHEDELFIRISNLKKLLDSGAITKEEYEQQKAKILN